MVMTTKIGLGVESDRIHKGMAYGTPQGDKVHSTLTCRAPQDITLMELYPLFEEAGNLYILRDSHAKQVEMCDVCPEVLDLEWKDRAACMGTSEDMIGPHPESIDRIIATYCDNCPVVVECGEYAANTGDTGIWGGEYIMTRTAANKKRERSGQ